MDYCLHDIPAISIMLTNLVGMAETWTATGRARYVQQNPSRLVTPIHIWDGRVYVLTTEGEADAWHGRAESSWSVARAFPDCTPLAISVCDLHRVRPVWFD